MDEHQENNEYNAEKIQSDKLRKKSNKKLVEKSKRKSKRNKQKIGFYYSFLTIILIFCLIQVGFSVILNISKTVAYKSKIKTMQRVRNEAEQRNKDLKSDIKLFSKASSLEEIARNNLKMAGEKEVLVIINNTQPQQVDNKKKKKHSKK